MRLSIAIIISTLVLALSGCVGMEHLFCSPRCGSSTHNSSSLVSFLYPSGPLPPPDDALPELRLPLRVGLAFLPPQSGGAAQTLDEARKNEILERIRAHFAERKFISEIIIIPDYYLATNRGFEGLQGVQRLYDFDVMALVSYDQVTHMADNNVSLGYLTIVGAYVLPGTEHDVATLVDLAVVDPVTRTLLLRAGGVDTRHAASTLIAADRDTRLAGAAGFDAAADQLIGRLDQALDDFQSRVRAGTAKARLVSRNTGQPVRSGGGAVDLWSILVLLLVFGWRLGSRRRVTFASCE
jgi:rhombotail lipoprotein